MTDNAFVEVSLRALRAAHSSSDPKTQEARRRAYRTVFNSGDGMIVLADIMGQGGVFASSGPLSRSAKVPEKDALAVASGRRDLALWILQQLYPEEMVSKRARKQS